MSLPIQAVLEIGSIYANTGASVVNLLLIYSDVGRSLPLYPGQIVLQSSIARCSANRPRKPTLRWRGRSDCDVLRESLRQTGRGRE